MVEEIMRFPILNAAPVTIAAIIFGTSSDKNTNGEKLKNNNIDIFLSIYFINIIIYI